MLTEERHAHILNLLADAKAVTVQDLTRLLETSESTIRRDLTTLQQKGKLHKVHGGATALNDTFHMEEDEISVKYSRNTEEKRAIARFAATLVKPHDFVYLDAGTSTDILTDYLAQPDAVYVTNAITHAKKLAQKGYQVYVLAGRFKGATEAIVGSEAIISLARYNFTIGFFGTNGIDLRSGYTTPDMEEARIKTEALTRCQKAYVLADSSKFHTLSAITFGELEEARIITGTLQDGQFAKHTEIMEVDQL